MTRDEARLGAVGRWEWVYNSHFVALTIYAFDLLKMNKMHF